jgi:NADPH:quinone reductase-like Zn-dependent oxidoreductase
VGTFAVQIAKWFGANVTGVCSTRNVEIVRSIGADRVIDYTQEDFTTTSRRYDLLLDCVGNHSLSACRRVLNPGGRLVMVGAPSDASLTGLLARSIEALVLTPFLSRKMCFFIAKVNKEDLTTLGDLMATGKITPVIDRRYRLNEAVEAFRYMEEGHARGKVVITLEHNNET